MGPAVAAQQELVPEEDEIPADAPEEGASPVGCFRKGDLEMLVVSCYVLGVTVLCALDGDPRNGTAFVACGTTNVCQNVPERSVGPLEFGNPVPCTVGVSYDGEPIDPLP